MPLVPVIKPTLTVPPVEGVSETSVTVARNDNIERFAEGKGGVATSVSESVPLAPPMGLVLGMPPHE